MGEAAKKVVDENKFDGDLREGAISEDFGQYELATANQRVLALLLDFVIISVGVGVFNTLAAAALHLNPKGSLLSLMGNFISVMYFTFMEYNNGQTLGKKVMKIKVVADNSDDLMGFGQVLDRETIGRVISILPLGLGYMGASTREDRKTFHDRIFKTRVIRLP